MLSNQQLLIELFYLNENTLQVSFTKVMQALHYGKKFRLWFDNEGVHAVIEGVDEPVLIYMGAYHFDFNKEREDE